MLEHDLFFISETDTIFENSIILRSKNEANHIANVMRKSVGSLIYLSDGHTCYYLVEIKQIAKREIECQIVSTHDIPTSKSKIKLYNSLLKGSTFDLQIEKSVEIGVTEFCPTITDHVIAKKSKLDKWQDTIKTALKQSKQPRIIPISEPMKLTQLSRSENEIWIVPEIGTHTVPFHSISVENKDISVFIGPEGGFSPRELTHFEEQGATFHSLGKNRLRAETATWVTLTLVHNLIEKY